jgi:molecular chaperone GrpE
MSDGERKAVADQPVQPGAETPAEQEQPPQAAPQPSGETGMALAPETPPSREELEALRRERDELRDLLLRKRADFENFRKRMERDRTQAGQEAAAELVQALIPALDNLDRALAAAGGADALRQGVELIRREMLTALEQQGVTVQDPLGTRFDPQLHQALSTEEVPGAPGGTVVEVFRKAYLLGGRLLRPALVKVSKGEETEPASPEASKSEIVH